MPGKVNKLYFPQITTTAKGLGIITMISATIKNRNNVIKFKMFCASTEGAFGISPFSSLPWSKFFAVSAKFRWLMESVRFSPWHFGNHFVTRIFPHFFRSFGNFLSGLFGMLESNSIFVSEAFSFSALRNTLFSFFRVAFSPKRIAFARMENISAFTRAGFITTLFYSCRRTVKLFSANNTVEILTSSFSRCFQSMPPLNNGVNSINNSIIQKKCNEVNIEPSKKGNFFEGATTMGRAYGRDVMAVISRTSAPPEREDIV